MTVWHNHKLKDDNTPLLPFADRVRLGDAVFDTMLVVNGEPVHAAMHVERLLNDAKVLGITVDVDLKDLVRGARQILKEGRLENGRAAINTLISRGSGERGLMPPDFPDPQVMMRAVEVPADFPPLKAVIARFVRRNEGSPLSRIKSANYGDNILALMEAREVGANEAILLNNKGHITCATSGNIYVVVKGRIYTPPLADGVLDGITRRLLMKRIDVIEKSMTEDDLQNAEGMFLTSSIRGLVPFISLDGNNLPLYDIGLKRDFHFI